MRHIFVVKEATASSVATAEAWAERLAQDFKHEKKTLFIGKNDDIAAGEQGVTIATFERLSQVIEAYDASMLVFEIERSADIQRLLNACRAIRIPYLMVKPGQVVETKRVGLPVSFLIEEREKAPFASAFGRFCRSELIIYRPKDYGTKAQQNIDVIKTLLDTFSLPYSVKQGKKDSFGIEKETVAKAKAEGLDLVIVSASREYGLDDLIFGSKERHILKQAELPILLINPRDDLYALCD